MTTDQALPFASATNPVLSGFHPDPSICRVDGADGTWYYLATSTFEYLPGLPIHRSRDLVEWELVGHAIHRPEQLDLSRVADSQGLFAPTIRHDGERFLVVCTVVGGTDGASGNFVVTAEDAAGPWSDPIWWEGGGIDPSLFLDDGSIWAHGTRPARNPEWDQQTEVWVRELDPVTLQLKGDEHIVWSGAVRGAVWAEGPHLYRKDGRVYLLASEGGTSIHHALSVARADHPTGPYEGCKGNPIFTHRHLGRSYPVINVGHADLVEAPDGSWYSVVLASRPVEGVDVLGRETFLVPVEWEDGWPVFAPGTGTLVADPTHPTPEVGVAPAPAASASDLLAVRRLPEEVCTVDGDRLVVTAGDGLGALRPGFVGRRLSTLPATVGVTLQEVPDGVLAGVALRYDSTAWATALVGPDPDGCRIRLLQGGSDGERVVAEHTASSAPRGRVELAIEGLEARASWMPEDGERQELGSVSLAEMGAIRSGGFVGTAFGILAIGDGTVTAAELRQD